MSGPVRGRFDVRSEAEAAAAAEEMFLVLAGRDASPDDWDRHARNLEASAVYRQRFDECRSTWRQLDALEPDASASAAERPRPSRQTQARRWALAASLLLIAAGGLLSWRALLEPGVQTLRLATAIGEHREVELPDGSTLALGARTSVSFRYSRARRTIDLEHGQLLVSVAHEEERPFVVATDDVLAMATGTVFDVRKAEAYSTVSVVDGTVKVVARSGGGDDSDEFPKLSAGRSLAPGQQLRTAAGDVPHIVRQVDIARITAWRSGQLYFHEEALQTVFEEVMRYSDVSFRVADPALARRLYTGSFRPDGMSAWLDAISRAYGLRIVRDAPDRISVAPAYEAATDHDD